MNGWGKVRDASKYAGISPRTFRAWLKEGLAHSRMPSGTILIRFADVDFFLKKFEVRENKTVQIADEVVRGMRL
ncbi:MAG: hypothetical protein V1714_01590 [Pseudomonadota bacterium]